MEFLDQIEFVLREGEKIFIDFLSRYSHTLVALFFLLFFVVCIVVLVLWMRGDI